MNALLDKIGQLTRTRPAGQGDPNSGIDDWGRLSGADKVARAESLARDAYRAGDNDLAEKWRGLAAEIRSQHQLGSRA